MKNNKVFSDVKNLLLLFFIFLLPTQFGKHFFFDFSYVLGVRVDYLAPTLYLTDIIIFILIVLYARTIGKAVKTKQFLIAFLLLGINILFSQSPYISLYATTRLIELYFIYVIAKNTALQWKYILIAFIAGAGGELALGLYHAVTKQSLQSLAYYFGERSFTLSTPGIAKGSLRGVELLRPYGTFSHPNSLGGFYLLLFTFTLTFNKFRSYPYVKVVLLALSSLLVFLSFSKTAIFAYLLISMIYIFTHRKTIGCTLCVVARISALIIVSCLFFFFQSDPASFEKRITLAKNSIVTIFTHPFFGVGNGAYILSQANNPAHFLNFLNQPVHSIFLLYFAQMGLLVGFAILFVLFPFFRSILRKYPLIFLALFITGLNDHYWLTLHQNMLLAAFILGSVNRRL